MRQFTQTEARGVVHLDPRAIVAAKQMPQGCRVYLDFGISFDVIETADEVSAICPQRRRTSSLQRYNALRAEAESRGVHA